MIQIEPFLSNMRNKEQDLKKSGSKLAVVLLLVISNILPGQITHDTLPSQVTLNQCITYALANQALVRQAMIDEEITRRDIRISTSGWYPQLGFDANLQHYLQIPLTNYPNVSDPSSPGLSLPSTSVNVSSGIFTASQSIYNSDLIYAARNSGELRNQALQNIENSKITAYSDVTKAFFDVLLTQEQFNVLNEDILRLQQNYKTAYHLYENGLTDRIDYQRTEIALGNARAQKRSVQESLKAKYAVLKQLMGVAPEKQMTVLYDTSRYENEILCDTARILDYTKRIEYLQLQTALNLQNSGISYYRWAFLPDLSAFYEYTARFRNDRFPDLYNKAVPTSLFGLRLTLPIFQGMQRLENLSKSKLQYQRLLTGMDYLKSVISSEHALALARYTGNLNELKVAKRNITLAKDIYNTVRLQYEKGIKAYLEVIVSETDLRTAELNYLNVLFQVLSSKVDLEKASGDIKIN
jgi:outer membrane protein TolC